MADGTEPKIQHLIATFTAASSALQIYFQQQRPLTPLQLKSLSLCTSMLQYYLEKTLNKRQLKNMNSSAAAILGRLGGLKGGKARANKLSPMQRAESARLAARSRWGKPRSR